MRNLLALSGLLLTACMGVEQGIKIEDALEKDREHRETLIEAEKERTEAVTKLAGQLEHVEADYDKAAKAQWERINAAVESMPKLVAEGTKPLLPAEIFSKAMELWRSELNVLLAKMGEYKSKLDAEQRNDDRIANFLGSVVKPQLSPLEKRQGDLDEKIKAHIKAQAEAEALLLERLGRLEANAIEAKTTANSAKTQAEKTEATWDKAIISKVDQTDQSMFWLVVMFLVVVVAFLLYVLRDYVGNWIPWAKKKESK